MPSGLFTLIAYGYINDPPIYRSKRRRVPGEELDAVTANWEARNPGKLAE